MTLKFLRNEFDFKKGYWPSLLSPLAGKSNIYYLEIGTREGASLIWVLENILNGDLCKATAIDCFFDNTKEILLENIKIVDKENKVSVLEGYSQIILRTLPLNSYDFIYIDGSHRGQDILTDAILSWGLLKKDGILIFDDYGYHDPDYGAYKTPKFAIDQFLHIFQEDIEILYRGFDVFIRKCRETYI